LSPSTPLFRSQRQTQVTCPELTPNSRTNTGMRGIRMYDVVIIGAGPAGLSATIACRESNLDVLVIDEFPKPGGRLLGQLHQEPNGEWWNGIEETKALLEKAEKLNTTIQCEVSCHHLEKIEAGYRVHTNRGLFETKNILLATGAAE